MVPERAVCPLTVSVTFMRVEPMLLHVTVILPWLFKFAVSSVMMPAVSGVAV